MSGPGPIHEAVARQAAATPGATAVVGGGERIGYAELDAASSALAVRLRDRGVVPGSLVPVALPRSAQLIAVLLGVLKCGAAYAALDPRWPAARLRGLLDVLKPPLLVAAGTLPGTEVPTWAPPAGPLAALADPRASDTLAPGVTGDDPATVFFTSGTTGAPKAVLSPHRATTRLTGMTAAWSGPGRTMAQAAPASWDAYALEVWGTLTAGGTCVVTEGDHLLPGTLRTLVREHGVDTVFLTTSVFSLFAEEDVESLGGLRHVLTGGERLPAGAARRCLAAHPDLALINGYGPVESCVFATTHRVRPEDCAAACVPLGTAVPGTAVHVLEADAPAATGTEAEICISGAGLALEYLGAPGLTAEHFPVVRIGGVPTRIYRTGDRGLLDDRGTLHFRGRTDRQVKIAGHRIEPREIEEVGSTVPGVRECVVEVLPDDSGSGRRLAMFYTVASPGTGGHRDLPPPAMRRELSARLPGHLVPHVLRRCPALPLTANGKLDHAALLASLSPPRSRHRTMNRSL
ncbi:amino acid adenylation domain-containing protein [Streptomyces albofaciens JCM 4342]|uniref:amino acid adenylation domain-containing protein n=1 Tax=Streptomyces albofaciens TaxID=66866 RepID=UPI00123AA341|nr:amino acid adenylation domain-containing protein [Streptomyces albofaciens]KAA6214845.1 amino acid adenylation domain-containing protein [Streptomyces albofaciens JCM 4342]